MHYIELISFVRYYESRIINAMINLLHAAVAKFGIETNETAEGNSINYK